MNEMTKEEWLREKIRNRDKMLEIRWEQIENLKTRSSFWHGKWAIVCHENNVLRRKMQIRDEIIAILQWQLKQANAKPSLPVCDNSGESTV